MGDAQHHEHGTMDIKVQEHTFAGFITAVKWGIGLSIAALVFLAIFNS